MSAAASSTVSAIGESSGGDQKVTLTVDSQQQQEQQQQQDHFEAKKSRKDLIRDCALVEIIHLHDCLRGAINALEKDLIDLSKMVLYPNKKARNFDTEKDRNSPPIFSQEALRLQLQHHHQAIVQLESKATARFQVIWSVFRAHSAAEDEFIWPTLRDKTKGVVTRSPCGSPKYQQNDQGNLSTSLSQTVVEQQHHNNTATRVVASNALEDDEIVEQEEYEEDHADEERMFIMMDHLLTRLHKGLIQLYERTNTYNSAQSSNGNDLNPKSNKNGVAKNLESITNTTKEILSLAKTLNQHLMVHLEKEEKNCLPLVVKHLSKSEIHDLVGKIMGKRSSDTIAQILTMAVQNLKEADREDMVKHMKQAMVGTFFETWLAMTGWMGGGNGMGEGSMGGTKRKRTTSLSESSLQGAAPGPGEASKGKNTIDKDNRRPRTQISTDEQLKKAPASSVAASLIDDCQPKGEITSQGSLEKLIRAVVTNPSLTPVEKNTTIQGLRASVWKRNQQLMGKVAGGTGVLTTRRHNSFLNGDTSGSECGHLQFPSAYYRRDEEGKIECVWKLNDSVKIKDKGLSLKNASSNDVMKDLVPRFTASELAPNFQDHANGVLGCHHYARACKLRHAITGKLFTCRLCAEQEREASTPNEADPPFDRYAVTEIMCMKCKTLQPAAKSCVNEECELYKKGFAKYFCDICNLYDDRSRPIFHCPYCNTCRMGKGLGIDFRHCMRCNACVSIADKNHRCISQKLQGSCPICHDTLFNSTEPLKGLRCGHVMHLSCYTQYCRGQNYTCPLCKRCMEDMSDYFSLLDQAVRMQPMPAAFQNTIVNTYCQDCEKTGQCRYHFVGQKCSHCGSYNTREMGRYEQTQCLIGNQRR